jgi:hypothetical protein
MAGSYNVVAKRVSTETLHFCNLGQGISLLGLCLFIYKIRKTWNLPHKVV